MNVGSNFLFLFFLTLPFTVYGACPDTTVLMQRGHLLKNQGQYLLSSQQYSLVTAISCSSQEKALATYYYAASLYQLDEKEAAESIIVSEIKKSDAGTPLERKMRLLEAWYEPHFRDSLMESDKKSFASFEEAKKEIENNKRIKTPWVAGSLSALLPGLGQVYNNNYASAATSFVLNALFLAAALELKNRDLHAPALAAGVLFSTTYTGSIFGSVESSKQINRAYQAPLIDETRKKSIPDLEL